MTVVFVNKERITIRSFLYSCKRYTGTHDQSACKKSYLSHIIDKMIVKVAEAQLERDIS
jgi:hypothetical protein